MEALQQVEAYERDLPRKLLRSRRGPPPGQEECVRATLRDVFGISEPRRYQIAAVFRLVYCKPAFMYLIHKTGEGKSLVMLAMAFMLRQVTVVLGPLHGLAADQVCKSKRLDKGVEAWHADEFRGPFHARLAHRMMNVRSEDVVLLFISPQALQDREEGSKYYRVLERLAMKGQISSFCVDEVHMTVECADSFRPEFRAGVDAIKRLLAISRHRHPDKKIPLLAMSATFRIPEQISFNKMIGRTPDVVF